MSSTITDNKNISTIIHVHVQMFFLFDATNTDAAAVASDDALIHYLSLPSFIPLFLSA